MKLVTNLLLLLALLSACAGPQLQVPRASTQDVDLERQRQLGLIQDKQDMAFRTLVEEWRRIFTIYSRLRVAGAELCKTDIKPFWGVWLADQSLFPADDRDRAKRLLGVDQKVSILAVSGLASSAGLRPGDVVSKIDGVVLGSHSWVSEGSYLQRASEVLAKAGARSVEIEIMRLGEKLLAVVTPEPGCRYSVTVEKHPEPNAFATGDAIVISTAMVELTSNDDELAHVISHELAHNVLGHIDRKKANVSVGVLLGALVDVGLLVAAGVNTQGVLSQAGGKAGLNAYSQEFEREADYMSLYFMTRAGFDTTKAADAQRKFGIAKPGSLYSNYASTHPSSPERAANLDVALQEVAGKLARREPLTPAKLSESQDVQTASANTADTQALHQQVKVEQERRASAMTSTLKPLTPEKKPESVRRVATLTHVKGRVISSPPAVLQAEYSDSGEGQGTSRIIYPGNYILEGEFQTLPWNQPFKDQTKARLIDLERLVAPPNSMLKGFATYSSSDGTVMECAFSVSNASRVDRGQCFDNRGNVYRISY